MKRKYPKNRKGISGRPFARRTSHKADCGWCGHIQDAELMLKVLKDRKKMSYPCDNCTRRLVVQVTANGFLTTSQQDRARYLRNVERKTNRI